MRSSVNVMRECEDNLTILDDKGPAKHGEWRNKDGEWGLRVGLGRRNGE